MKHASFVMLLMAGGLACVQAVPAASPSPQAGGNVSTAGNDRDTTQKIRQAIVADRTLSAYAHNVKILVHGGKVTLRGPVRSDAEKQTVAQMASSIAGADNITNQLTVDPAK